MLLTITTISKVMRVSNLFLITAIMTLTILFVGTIVDMLKMALYLTILQTFGY